MLIIEKVNKEAIIRLHNDYIKDYEASKRLLEKSYKLALLELYRTENEEKK